jgi:hypothetical protein
MLFRKSLFVLAAAVSAHGQTVPSYSDRPIVRRQLPPDVSLQGLWQILSNGKVFARFNINQTGNAVSIQFINEGKGELPFYEGTLQDRSHISGKCLDFRSADYQWVPMEISVIDVDHLRSSRGDTLIRATPSEAASFKEYRRISSLPMPATRFDLNGIWTVVEDGTRVAIAQNDGHITLTVARPDQPPFFHGSYTANPTITGQLGRWSTVSKTLEWTDSTITVVSPDHISVDNKLLYRQSNPASHDLVCDDLNSNRVRDYYAFVRGAVAYSERDYESAKCWLKVSTYFEYAPALSMLSALLLQDGSPDYTRAFNLASRGAAQNDVPAEFLLASLYREGKGTTADPVKARYWQQKADTEQSASVARFLAAKNPFGLSPIDIGRMSMDFFENASKDNYLSGAGCFSEIFVPAGRHPCK